MYGFEQYSNPLRVWGLRALNFISFLLFVLLALAPGVSPFGQLALVGIRPLTSDANGFTMYIGLFTSCAKYADSSSPKCAYHAFDGPDNLGLLPNDSPPVLEAPPRVFVVFVIITLFCSAIWLIGHWNIIPTTHGNRRGGPIFAASCYITIAAGIMTLIFSAMTFSIYYIWYSIAIDSFSWGMTHGGPFNLLPEISQGFELAVVVVALFVFPVFDMLFREFPEPQEGHIPSPYAQTEKSPAPQVLPAVPPWGGLDPPDTHGPLLGVNPPDTHGPLLGVNTDSNTEMWRARSGTGTMVHVPSQSHQPSSAPVEYDSATSQSAGGTGPSGTGTSSVLNPTTIWSSGSGTGSFGVLNPTTQSQNYARGLPVYVQQLRDWRNLLNLLSGKVPLSIRTIRTSGGNPNARPSLPQIWLEEDSSAPSRPSEE